MDDMREWSSSRELWDMDLKDVDLGLVQDKLERAIREAYTKYLLTDAGSHRIALVIPSVLPHPLLSTILTTYFDRFKAPFVTLLSNPTMAAVGAGVRSALVIDIGWRETIVTAVYEYRELLTKRTNRAMRTLVQEMGQQLQEDAGFRSQTAKESLDRHPQPNDLSFLEDLALRLAWCRQASKSKDRSLESTNAPLERLSLNDSGRAEASFNENEEIDIDWPFQNSTQCQKMPLAVFAEPVERTFFQGEQLELLDDQEQLLPEIVYRSLLALPPDIRAICMARITLIGGGSNIPGLGQRVITDVAMLVEKYGWDGVRGKVSDVRRNTDRNRVSKRDESHQSDVMKHAPDSKGVPDERATRARGALKPLDGQLISPPLPTPVQGVFRQLESMGSWAGASLLASLKIKGLVEIEREKFSQQGLSGAQREADISIVPQRMSLGPSVTRAGDRSSYTLAGWA